MNEIENALINFRNKVEKKYQIPLIEANIDFSQMYQGLIFKDNSSALFGISQENIYAGHWIKSVWRDICPDFKRYFFLEEIRRGDHEKWLAEHRKEYSERVNAILKAQGLEPI